jgi:hypothetical protein
LEIGITDRFQVGIYPLDWAYYHGANADDDGFSYEGGAVELIYNLSNPVVDPGISLYEEIAASRQHFEPESKLIAQKKFGQLVMAGDGADWASFFYFAKIARPANGAYALSAPFFEKLMSMQNGAHSHARVLYSVERWLVHLVVGTIVLFALRTNSLASAGQEPPRPSASFEVPRRDVARAGALANKLAALSTRVDTTEATRLAECAYATADRLRRQYQMFGTPIFNNFLVYHGFRKRGYCYQWTADLLVALDALKLKTLELHWGESYAGTWRENNCLVITAKGQSFDSGMIVDAWRHFGQLRWNLVLSDEDRYFENTKYAQLVRTRAASKSLRADGHVALQRRVTGNAKAGDQ